MASFVDRLKIVLNAWWHQPSQVATVVPSSAALIEEVCHRSSIRESRLVVELGPGAGGTTISLLEHMRPDAKLIAIEKTKAFIDPLNAIEDERLLVEHGNASDLIDILQDHRMGSPDLVISGIPMSMIPNHTGHQIVQAIHASLRSNGEFIAYQFKDDIDKIARPYFGPSHQEFVPFNIPPLSVYSWKKVS